MGTKTAQALKFQRSLLSVGVADRLHERETIENQNFKEYSALYFFNFYAAVMLKLFVFMIILS
jgi:hypothetical protein